jgi:hypothetical protein
MLERIYAGFIAFFGVLAILGVYMGYHGKISTVPALMAVSISAILAWKISKEVETVKTAKTRNLKPLVLLLSLFLAIEIYLILPHLVFPHGAGDFANHARSVRIIAKDHSFNVESTLPLVFPHRYPHVYYGTASLFYSLFPHTYMVNSLFPIMLQVLSLLGVFFTARKIFNEKIALLSTFISGFAITNLFALEQGFFPFIMGQFFFIASAYSYLIKDRKLLLLSNAGLISYPHLFVVYIIFLVLETLRTKRLENFIMPAAAFMLMAPESIGLAIKHAHIYSPVPGKSLEPFRGSLLIKGGILTPTLFSLLIFIFAIGFYRNRERRLINLNLSIIILILATFAAFGYDYLRGYTKDLHLLYMAPKLFYLLVLPLSIVTAVGMERLLKKKAGIALILSLYWIYFAGYAFTVLPSKASFPGEFYEIAEKMDTWPGEFTVGVDPELGTNIGWKPRFPYKSIIDLPDEGYTLDTVELNRAFQFHWASYAFTEEGPLVINSKGEPVVKYSYEDVDYYITKKELNRTVILKKGGIKVYKMR